jgi:hypothetical protein
VASKSPSAWPAVHSWHATSPGVSAVAPFEHSVHSVLGLPSVSAKPATHSVHDVEPGAL